MNTRIYMVDFSPVNVLCLQQRPDDLQSVLGNVQGQPGIVITGLTKSDNVLETLLVHEYDAVILVYDKDGYDCIRMIKRIRADGWIMPLIVIHPDAEAAFVDDVLRAGADFILRRDDDGSTLRRYILKAGEMRDCCATGCLEAAGSGQLLQSLPIGFVMHRLIRDQNGDPFDYRYLEANLEYERMTGINATSLRGITITEGMRDGLNDLCQHLTDIFDKVISNRIPITSEIVHEKSKRPLKFMVYSPCPEILATVFHDLSDHQNNVDEAVLHQESFFDAMSDLGVITDLEGRLIKVNERFLDITGYNIREINRTFLPDITKANEKNEFLLKMQSAHDEGKTIGHSAHLLNKHGQIFDVDWKIWYVDGFYYFLGVDRTDSIMDEHMMQKGVVISDYLLQKTSDINYSRLTDIALDLSGAKYAVFNLYRENGLHFQTKAISVRKKTNCDESIPGTCTYGATNNTNSDLQKVAELLGFEILDRVWEHDEVLEKRTTGRTVSIFTSLREMTGNKLPQVTLRIIETLFRIGETVHIRIESNQEMLGNFTLIMPKGKRLRNHDMLEIYSHQVGTVIMRKRAEQSYSMANRKLKILSDVTRHDIMNQMTVVQGYLELSQNNCNEPRSLNYLEKMMASTDIIMELFEFTRQYEMMGKTEPAWESLRDLVNDSVHDMMPLENECPDLKILADPLIEKVFYNLMDNTIRHGTGATKVKIRCRKEKQHLVLIWEDDGMGIEGQFKEKIFQHGFGKNTGLGLGMIREVLEMMDMSIVETGVYKKGARFEIRIPNDKFILEKK